MTKVCTKCNEAKPLTAFSKKRWVNKDGTIRERPRALCNKCRYIAEKPSTPEQREERNVRAAQRRQDRLSNMTPAERAEYNQKQYVWGKEWKRNNPDKVFLVKQRYRKRHKDTVAAKKAADAATPHGKALDHARHRKYYANRSEEIKARAKLRRYNLDDAYVKSLVFRCKIPAHLIPASLVEARRLHVQIKRELKEKLS